MSVGPSAPSVPLQSALCARLHLPFPLLKGPRHAAYVPAGGLSLT